MKKIFTIVLCIIITAFCFNKNKNVDNILIPNEAIRLRILANSNSIYDQATKQKVSNEVQKYLYQILKDKKTISENRNTIKNNVDNINSIVSNTLKSNNTKMNFKVNYGYNYFPEKTYKGVKYNNGNYESLLITLGNGSGDNWWCVLFPPLCLIEAEKSTEVEYKFFVSELINKYFTNKTK